MYTEYLSPDGLVSKTKATGCIGISWTFNEPSLWFEYTFDGAKIAKAKGVLLQIMLQTGISQRWPSI